MKNNEKFDLVLLLLNRSFEVQCTTYTIQCCFKDGFVSFIRVDLVICSFCLGWRSRSTAEWTEVHLTEAKLIKL